MSGGTEDVLLINRAWKKGRDVTEVLESIVFV